MPTKAAEIRFTESPRAHLILETGLVLLDFDANGRTAHEDVTVEIASVGNGGLDIFLRGDAIPVRGLHLRWPVSAPAGALYLSDAWARAEGEHAWRTLDPERTLPWYFLWHHAGRTGAAGVATDALCIASFQADPEGLSLYLDTRNGGSGVILNGRRLKLATLHARAPQEGESPWQAARAFARQLVVETPRPFYAPVYGSNNWYYTYGKIDAAGVLRDAKRTAEWAGAGPNRPYMLIDDGWQVAHCDARYNGGPWHAWNPHFDDMAQLASDMRDAGVRPGLWYRPLVTLEGIMEPFMIRNGAKPAYAENGFSLDPTFSEAAARIAEDARRIADWGYEMIKHDFTTIDLLGTWANGQGGMASPSHGWHFHDRSKTNAEIVRELYALIHRSAKGSVILGCQTIGHLGVGTLDLQRVGGDVDGRGWERTRRMGINSLAFRLHQHGIFYQVDADCAPVTPTLPWEMSSQWLDLLARSGTPLFVSADPASLNPETNTAIESALRRAAKDQPAAEALDWMDTRSPRQWSFGDETRTYQWMPDIGCPPQGLLNGDAARLVYGS